MGGSLVHATKVMLNFLAEIIIAFTATESAGFFKIIEGKAATGTAAVGLFAHGGVDFGCRLGSRCMTMRVDFLVFQKKALRVCDALFIGTGLAELGFLADAVNNLGIKDGSLVVTVFALHHWNPS